MIELFFFIALVLLGLAWAVADWRLRKKFPKFPKRKR